jgi:hypothetical protein
MRVKIFLTIRRCSSVISRVTAPPQFIKQGLGVIEKVRREVIGLLGSLFVVIRPGIQPFVCFARETRPLERRSSTE